MAKIHLNLQQGIIDIEGDETFVRDSFELVRASMSGLVAGGMPDPGTGKAKVQTAEAISGEQKPPQIKKNNSTSKAKYKPKVDVSLNVTSLEGFYGDYIAKNNPEKLLVFCAYIRDKLKMSTCTADQLFTCFMALKNITKIPEAFAKNIHDAKAAGYLHYDSLSEIAITTVGENALVKLAAKTN